MTKISVITSCYNQEKYIAKTIDSVIASIFSDWDYVIVDDGSTDKSAEIILGYAKKEPRLQLVKQPNRGVCHGRNRGSQACSSKSEYLMFLDGDDCIEPEMLEVVVKYLNQYSHVGLVYSEAYLIDSEDRIFQSNSLMPRFFLSEDGGFGEVPDDIPETPFFSIAVGVCRETGVVLRKSVYNQTSGWPEWLGQGCEGQDLFMQMALISDVHFIPQSLYKYRYHETQSHKRKSINDRTQLDKLMTKWKQVKGLTPEKQGKITQVLESVPAYTKFLLARDELHTSG